jgi:hypothetical protein
VIIFLANQVFTDCIAITFMWDSIVIELPASENREYQERLKELPEDFERCAVDLVFHNGPLANTEAKMKRLTQPNPKVLGGIADETDYVKSIGAFFPGTMLSSAWKSSDILGSVTAGILVEKGSRQRLTCSFHCWEKHFEKYPSNFGLTDPETQKIFQILQGSPGTCVGFVRERIGNTDIALAQLGSKTTFRNSFMEIDCAPKTFLPRAEVDFGDEFLMDSFVTGKQKFRCNGTRFIFEREPGKVHKDLYGPANLLPQAGVAYIKLEQLACATNEPIMTKPPYVREGVCGAVLVRCKMANDRTKTQKEVMERGEVAAMMHYADSQSLYVGCDNYFIYADSFDPLAADGWRIVQEPELRELQDEKGEGSRSGPSQEISSKKRKEAEESESGAVKDGEESPTKKLKETLLERSRRPGGGGGASNS